MVEAWRLNKHEVHAAIPAGQQLHLFLIFTDIKMPDYETIHAAVVKGIGRLKERVAIPPMPEGE